MDAVAQSIADFYSKLNFPGPYSIEDLKTYDQGLFNQFLMPYDIAVEHCHRVLDIGCGSGFISNLLAHRHKDVQFYAVDFSDSIEYANNFAKKNSLSNIQYQKIDFFDFATDIQFNCIISNGVLHHMPRYKEAIQRINLLLADNGKLVVGLYNSYGKFAKKIIPINYRNSLLYKDQELVPYEMAFVNKEVIDMFSHMDLESVYPSWHNKFIDLFNIFNYKNGGLTIYSFRKNSDA